MHDFFLVVLMACCQWRGTDTDSMVLSVYKYCKQSVLCTLYFSNSGNVTRTNGSREILAMHNFSPVVLAACCQWWGMADNSTVLLLK